MAIDFNYFLRGQQEGRKALDEAQRFRANESTYALQELNNIYAIEDANIGRQAAAYLAPLTTHRQRAAQQGVDPVDFIVSQQQAMLADPAYQNFSPDVQQAINDKLEQQVALTAETLIRNKDFAGLQKLVDTMGTVSPIGVADQSSMVGDTSNLIAALAEQGVPATITPDGKVEVNGVAMDPNTLNRLYSQFNGNMALAIGAYETEVKQQADVDRASKLTAALATSGSVLGEDGNYVDSTTGRITISKDIAELMGLPTEGGTFTPTGVDGQPPAPVGVDGLPQTPPVEAVGTPPTPDSVSATPVTGMEDIVRVQEAVTTGTIDTLPFEELERLENAPRPSVETVFTAEEFEAYNDPRTPPEVKAQLITKLTDALAADSKNRIAVGVAKEKATPKMPTPEEYFTSPADKADFEDLQKAIATGGGMLVLPALERNPEFKAKWDAYQMALQSYRKRLTGL